jgi:hypothetical protein
MIKIPPKEIIQNASKVAAQSFATSVIKEQLHNLDPVFDNISSSVVNNLMVGDFKQAGKDMATDISSNIASNIAETPINVSHTKKQSNGSFFWI